MPNSLSCISPSISSSKNVCVYVVDSGSALNITTSSDSFQVELLRRTIRTRFPTSSGHRTPTRCPTSHNQVLGASYSRSGFVESCGYCADHTHNIIKLTPGAPQLILINGGYLAYSPKPTTNPPVFAHPRRVHPVYMTDIYHTHPAVRATVFISAQVSYLF